MYLSPVFCIQCHLVYLLFLVCLPCPVLPLMLSVKTIILKYFLFCVLLVSPWCVHRDRRPDQTVSVVPSPHFVLFVFSSLCFVPVFCPFEPSCRRIAADSSRWSSLAGKANSLPQFSPPSTDPAVRGRSRRRPWGKQPTVSGCL